MLRGILSFVSLWGKEGCSGHPGMAEPPYVAQQSPAELCVVGEAAEHSS